MKPHFPFLALSVLCSGSAAISRLALAQLIDPAAEVPPANAPPAPPASAPSAATSAAAATTAVDSPPPTPVNASPTPPAASLPPTPSLPAPPPAASLPPAASPPPAASLPPAPAPVLTANGKPRLAPPRLRDAHHDRILLTPTAETNPKGSFYGTSYEIVALQLGYSLTDFTQVSLTVVPLLDPEDFVLPGDLSIKTVVLRERGVSVAAIASASGILGFEEFSGFLGRAGGAVSFCVDAAECRLGVSFGSSVALAGPASVWFNGFGMSWRLTRLVGLLAEVDALLPLGEEVGEANGLLGGLGVRLSGRAWGVDLALMRSGKAGADWSPVIPFIAATYRRVP